MSNPSKSKSLQIAKIAGTIIIPIGILGILFNSANASWWAILLLAGFIAFAAGRFGD